MTESEKDLLNNFIDEFLPPSGNKRKYQTNTMHSIFSSLQRIFFHHSKIELTWEEVVKAFELKGYEFFTANMRRDDETKREYFTPNQGFKAQVGINERNGRMKFSDAFYVNISPVRLSELRKCTVSIQPNANAETIEKRKEDQEILKAFFQII